MEITSDTAYTVTLSGADLTNVEGLLNKDGTNAATAGTTFNLASLEDWMAGSPAGNTVADAAATITVSNYAAPAITSATYDYTANQLVVTGTNFVSRSGGANDIDLSTLTFTGEGGASYTLTTATDVEIDSATRFTATLTGADLVGMETLLNKDGTTSATANTTYNLAAADNWMAQAPSGTNIADATGNGITVSNFANPLITSATYDFATGVAVLTGTDFVGNSGGANDIDVSQFTFTGEGGATYTLTDSSDVEVSSATGATFTLSPTDRLAVNGLLNKDGTTSATAGTTYNLAAADNWMAGAPAGNNIADATAGVTVSNYALPTVTSATFDYATGALVATGTNFTGKSGGANDIDLSLFTFTGEGGGTYTLTSATDVEITSATAFSATLSGADLTNVKGLLNKDGTNAATAGTTYNLAAADNWLSQAPAGTDIADATGNGITVSNYTAPAISSATYDWSNGRLVITGTNLVSKTGAANDIDASLFTLTGEGGSTHTLTDTSDVELTGPTAATITLSATDRLSVHGLLNKNGTSSGAGTAYNLAAADNWLPGAPAATDVSDASNTITVSNHTAPAITSATYDSNTGVLAVTGTNFAAAAGAANDIDISKLTLTGGTGGVTHTITSASDVEITSATGFTVTLSGADKTGVDALLDQVGTSSSGGTTYNIAAADNWLAAADSITDISDATNAVTVSIGPKITSAAYNAATGSLVVTGTNIQANGGGSDIDASRFTLTGEGAATYTLTDTSDVERDSATQFTLTLSATDKGAINQLLNKAGTAATGTAVYNIAAGDDWNTNVTAGNTADTTGNAITVSNVPAPAITSATYDASTGALVVTGTGFTKFSGGTNDVDVSKFTLTGEGAGTDAYTLTDSADVEITSATAFTVTLSSTDKAQVNQIIGKNGTVSTGGTTYNLAAAEDWAKGADTAVNVADATGNGITASNVSVPTITSATYHTGTGALVVTGTGLVKKAGAGNDIDISALTVTGEAGGTRTLTLADVEIDSATGFTVTLSGADKTAVEALLNKSGTSSTDSTTYNLAAAEDWAAGANASVNVVDSTGNGITVTVYTPPPSGGGGAPSPAPETSTEDGVTVQKETAPSGNSDATITETVIQPVTQTRVEDGSTDNTQQADIPMLYADSEGRQTATTVSLPVGVGLSATGVTTPLSQTDAALELIALIQSTGDSREEGDTSQMVGSGQAFLDGLGEGTEVLVHNLTLTTNTTEAPAQPIIVDGNVSGATGTGSVETLVIDVSQLPGGTLIKLVNVDFAVIVGQGRFRGGEGSNIVYAGDGSQNIVLGADDDILHGGAGDDIVGSEGGNDVIFGDAGDDTLFGGEGQDLLLGGTGTDVVTYASNREDYEITQNGKFITVRSLLDTADADSLLGIESIQFADQTISVSDMPDTVHDIQEVAGLYAAVYNRAPDLAGLNYWGDALEAGAMSLRDIATAFSENAKYDDLYGDATSTDQFVGRVYDNILGIEGDAAGRAYWGEAIESGLSRTGFFADIVFAALNFDQTQTAATGSDLDNAIQASRMLHDKVDIGIHFAGVLGENSNGAIDSAIYQQSVDIMAAIDSGAGSMEDAAMEINIIGGATGFGSAVPVVDIM